MGKKYTDVKLIAILTPFTMFQDGGQTTCPNADSS